MVPSCSPCHEASIGTQRDLPRLNFEVALSRSLSTILFLMPYGDVNIGLTLQKISKVVGLSTNYQTPFAIFCPYDS